jgi:hypothetical protein
MPESFDLLVIILCVIIIVYTLNMLGKMLFDKFKTDRFAEDLRRRYYA